MPSVSAIDTNPLLAGEQGNKDVIYNDNKFDFTFTPIKDNKGVISSYNVSISRKDSTFKNYPVQFIYQILVIDTSHKVNLVTKYLYLSAGEDKVTETEKLYYGEKLEGLQSGNYGIKFPITQYQNYNNMDLSIRDAAFNLKLDYHYRWWPRNSGFDFKFTNRDNIYLNCPVTIKRAITLHFKDIPSYTEWFTYTIKSGTTHTKGFKKFDHELTAFETTADDYYLQFQ